MKSPSLFSLTDETALIGLLSYGIYLAAIVAFSFPVGMLATGDGATALFLVRRVKRK